MKRCPESGSAKDVSEDFPKNDCNLVDRKESTYQRRRSSCYRHFHIDNKTQQRVSLDMILCVCVNMILFLCTVRLSGATADTHFHLVSRCTHRTHVWQLHLIIAVFYSSFMSVFWGQCAMHKRCWTWRTSRKHGTYKNMYTYTDRGICNVTVMWFVALMKTAFKPRWSLRASPVSNSLDLSIFALFIIDSLSARARCKALFGQRTRYFHL